MIRTGTPESRLEALLREKDCDAALITEPHSLQYLTGFTGGEAAALIGGKTRVLITDSRYTTQAEQECPGFSILQIKAGCPAPVLAAEAFSKAGFQTVLYEDASMTCLEYAAYHAQMRTARFVGAVTELVRLREVKTEDELERLAAAEEIGSDAYRYILTILRPGMTELEVAAELECFMKKAGAENLSFDTIAASGIRSAMPHGAASRKIIEEGDFLTMDFGCIYRGYCSDMTRTVVIGKASERQKEVYGTVLKAQEEALAALRPGLACSEIDRIARTVITDAGFGPYFGHALGHGVGLAIHEEPCLAPRDDTVLVPGMVVTVEPGIYIPGFGGVRIENMAAVTEDGLRDLTTADRSLIEIV